MASLKERLDEIRSRLAAALELSSREQQNVKMVAVSKSHPAWLVKAASELGVADFGENRIQELEKKAPALEELALSWHMIGHLQRNKVRQAVQICDVIQSVDSLPLLERINRIAGELGREPKLLIQVDLAGESAKTGLPPSVLPEVLKHGADLEHVEIRGLMLMPPFFDDPEHARPYFRKLRDLRDQMNDDGAAKAPLTELSMGMSRDFDIAISEGATIVRIGTGIFGDRELKGQ